MQEALALDPNHADALANSIICALHLGRPTGPLVQQLGQTNPNHVLLKRVRGVEESFKKAASAFA